jgi:2-succinyl-6-hydroxy-2,4-cyclohexadiene-1-carboxylate synthase
MAQASVNGLSIHYRDTGGDGFPLVLAHGFTGNARNWALTAPALRERFRLISPDHRGHGLSDKPAKREDYDLDLLADDLYQLLRGIGVESCYLAGHSMGGMVAQLLTLAHPEMVRALVLVDTAAETPKALRAIERAEDRQRLVRLVDEQGMEAVFEEQLKAADARVRENPAFVATWREQFLMTSADAYVGGAIGMSKRRPVVDRLGEIKVPTLVICGEKDEPFLDASNVMHENIPGSELVIIPGAGHNPQIETPVEFNSILSGFLDRVHAAPIPSPSG